MKKHILISALAVIILLLGYQQVLACTCGVRPSLLDSFEQSKLVVTARLISVEKASEKDEYHYMDNVKSAKMVVEKVYKGDVKPGEELKFAQGGGGDCVWTYDERNIGSTFLFYLGKPSRGLPFYKDTVRELMYHAITCGRSSGIEYAAEDIRFLENRDKFQGRTRFSGKLKKSVVGTADFSNLQIKIIGKNKTYTATTNKDGFYQIYDLPPGQYWVEAPRVEDWKVSPYELRYSSAILEGWMPDRNSSQQYKHIPIIINDRRHAELNLMYVYDTDIKGKVFSPFGRPMAGICVTAVSSGSRDSGYHGRSGCTDENGDFVISEVHPGGYILVAKLNGKRNKNAPDEYAFYPSGLAFDEAQEVLVEVGKPTEKTDIRIPNAGNYIEIRGKFLFADRKPVPEGQINFEPSESEKFAARAIRSDKKGNFSIWIPKQAAGTLFGEIATYYGEFKHCYNLGEYVDALPGESVNVPSKEIQIKPGKILKFVELVLPIPFCENK